MKKTLLTFCTALLLASSAYAQEITTTLFYGSPYVWRGQVLSSGFVFQPTVTAAYQGFSLSFFGNIDPKSNYVSGGQKVHLQEADLTAAYGATVGSLALSAGYTLYTFPLPGDGEIDLQPTHEGFASIGVADAPLSPGLFVAYDFDAFDGLYAEARIGQTFNVAAHPYTLGAALGFDRGFILEGTDSALSHLALTAGTTFAAGSLSFTPLIGFQVGLADEYKGMSGETLFYGGFGVTF